MSVGENILHGSHRVTIFTSDAKESSNVLSVDIFVVVGGGSKAREEFKQLHRNETYYLKGGDLYILAGNDLFRVHSYFFERESRVFREQLKLSVPPGKPRNGENEHSAIVVDSSSEEFQNFLAVFYNPKYSLYDWSIADWTAVLEQAHKWEFDEVKALVTRELNKLDMPLVDKIALYQKFNVGNTVLIPLYAELCSRTDALDENESEAIGIKATVLIFRVRETLRTPLSVGGKSQLPSKLKPQDIYNTIVSFLGHATTPDSHLKPSATASADSATNGNKRGSKANINGKDGSQGKAV